MPVYGHGVLPFSGNHLTDRHTHYGSKEKRLSDSWEKSGISSFCFCCCGQAWAALGGMGEEGRVSMVTLILDFSPSALKFPSQGRTASKHKRGMSRPTTEIFLIRNI